ncbi:hypothetical protein LCGC14_2241160 [marine sediment metagenome]|uniref:Uncharacterized protein n=1 Tax=marine sediment metagenome TaxID=412755 RepID=A0A0F9D560_9ZZZZ
MPKYNVFVHSWDNAIYEVEADSAEEAIEVWWAQDDDEPKFTKGDIDVTHATLIETSVGDTDA